MFEKRPLNKFSGEAGREDSEAIFEKRVAAIVSVSQAAWVGMGMGGGGHEMRSGGGDARFRTSGAHSDVANLTQ